MLTFVATQVSTKRVTSGSYVEALERKVKDYEVENARLAEQVRALKEEKYDLFERIMARDREPREGHAEGV